jgi:hypothetical protein
VRELEDCWQKALVTPVKPVLRFDLTGMTYIDTAGREFLAARHAEGAEFIASGCLMRAMVAEISTDPVPERRIRT